MVLLAMCKCDWSYARDVQTGVDLVRVARWGHMQNMRKEMADKYFLIPSVCLFAICVDFY